MKYLTSFRTIQCMVSFVVFFLVIGNVSGQFTEQTGISLTGVNHGSVAWGDYNNDGYLDILLTGGTGIEGTAPVSKIYKNNGDGSFTEQTGISITAVYNGSVTWGDYNNDGYLDILLTGTTNGNASGAVTKVYKNNGNGNFSEQTSIALASMYYSAAAWGDYNNDGYLDIVLSGYIGNVQYRSKIYKNNGNGTFTEQTSISLEGLGSSSVAWGDYNNDGYLDVILNGYSSTALANVAKIYKNNGDGTFTPQTGISLTGGIAGSAAWGDYNNDGYLDLLLTGFTGSVYNSKIYKNNGNGTFTEQTGISMLGVDYCSVVWGDYNNDGLLDILLTGTNDNIKKVAFSKIYKNNGDGTFSEQTSISLTGALYSSAAWGDYDNDGKLDILLSGNIDETSSFSKIYKNTGLYAANTSPSTPTNLQQSIGLTAATLSWDKATDTQTSQNGLSYNFKVGTTPGAFNIVAPMASTSNGFRLKPAIGNACQKVDGQVISNLPIGTYYWSVQAVDNSFAGGAWATEKSFKVVGSTDATLSDIKVNGTTISGFASSTLTYNVVLPAGTTVVPTITVAVNEAHATIKITQDASVTGSAVVLVTAQDGVTQKTYTVNFSVAASTNATLSDLLINGVTITDFAPTTTVYNMVLPTGTTSTPIVTATVAEIHANTTITQASSVTGTATIVVTAQDGTSKKTYTVNFSVAAYQVFSEQTGISLAGAFFSSVVWGDYNNDGHLDILLTGATDKDCKVAFSKIYKNNGNGTFTEQTGISLEGVSKGSAVWGDYNNDGYLDILLTGTTDGEAMGAISQIYKNNGDGTFSKQTGISLIGMYYSAAAWGDYNNDGYLDILLSGYSSANYSSKIYKNNGDGTFSEQTSISLIGLGSSSVAWGDFNNDGYLDIVLNGYSEDAGSIAKIYKNNGDGTFAVQTGSALTGGIAGSAAWNDYNNDGYLDLLLTGYTGSVYMSKVYTNNGDGTFAEQTAISLAGIDYCSVVWGDYDNDGYSDILLTGTTDGSSSKAISKIYRNNGNGTFTEQSNILLTGVIKSSAAWGDYDNDGKLDLVLSGYTGLSYVSKIYKNKGLFAANTAPLAPTNLAQTNGSGVTSFSWDKATDTQTPQAGLNYNLRVGTTPGSCNVVSPMSSASNGFRSIPSLGNAGQKTDGFVINNLPKGTYYWGVQAIDNGFAGGAWSDEKTFTVGAESWDAKLSDLKIDGITLSDFDPATVIYNTTLPCGTVIVPTIAATANDANATVQITQASSVNGSATVLITAQDGITQKTYTINFTVALPILSVSPHTINVGSTASNTAMFDVTSNTLWQVSCTQSWLKVSSISGSNNAGLTVSVEANPLRIPRTATIYIYGNSVITQSIFVTQAADNNAPFLILSSDTIKVVADESANGKFVIYSNVRWNVTAWYNPVSVSKDAGAGQDTILVKVLANPTSQQRIIPISVAGADGVVTKNIIVLQDAGISPAGVHDISDGGLRVYPNPVNDKLYISSSNFETISQIDIYQYNGILLFSTKKTEGTGEIDMRTFASGIYILKCYTSNGIIVKRIVKE